MAIPIDIVEARRKQKFIPTETHLFIICECKFDDPRENAEKYAKQYFAMLKAEKVAELNELYPIEERKKNMKLSTKYDKVLYKL